MDPIMQEDFENLTEVRDIEWTYFKGKTILVTGATGLIGKNLTGALLYANQKYDLNLKLILPVRNKKTAEELFGENDVVTYCDYDIVKPLNINVHIDIIIHLAAPTDSRTFVNKPIEVLDVGYMSCKNLLELGEKNNVQKFIMASTMEVYGHPEKDHLVSEDEVSAFKPAVPRNSYPISKIAAEALCNAYFNERNLPCNILRLTQTFGPGVSYTDNRIFAEIARCVIESKDIVLKTEGHTERMYLYTLDAVSAILFTIIKGEAGETYTVANENTYISIADMAEMVTKEVAAGKISVRYDIKEDISSFGYANTLYMKLDTDKIKDLGWSAKVDLTRAFERMIGSMQSSKYTANQ